MEERFFYKTTLQHNRGWAKSYTAHTLNEEKEKNMQRTIVSALAGIVLLVPSLSQAATWKSDSDHASIQFAVRHYMVSTVRGNFDTFDVTVMTH